MMNVMIVLVPVILICQIKKTDAVNCSQCNWRFLGVQNLCVAPRNVSGCIGCMKTVAKIRLRDSGYIDGWERTSAVISRYCITPGNTKVKPEGCYKQQNNGGYTERCYCYTDNCNSAATRPTLAFCWSFLPSLTSTSSAWQIVVVLLALIVYAGRDLTD